MYSIILLTERIFFGIMRVMKIDDDMRPEIEGVVERYRGTAFGDGVTLPYGFIVNLGRYIKKLEEVIDGDTA